MSHSSHLRITAELTQLEVLRRFVEEQATALGVEPAAVYDIVLAVEELATNIMVHGYRNPAGAIEIELRPLGDALELRLRDQAPPFDPTRVAPPDTTLPLELRPLAGMGIHLARHFMDSMVHRALPGGGNELILLKQGVL
jgi:serine/threonine-protein kinase RsbW